MQIKENTSIHPGKISLGVGRYENLDMSTLEIHWEMTELRGNEHSSAHRHFILRDISSTGDRIVPTREITRYRA